MITTRSIIYNSIGYTIIEDSTKVFAMSDIDPGQLLLVEHVLQFYAYNQESMINAILRDQNLLQELCPREEITDKSIHDLLIKKYYSNILINGSYHIIGRTLCKINHSCEPNAMVVYFPISIEGNTINIYSLYSIKPIKTGQEITIDYVFGNDYMRHDIILNYHNIKCNCLSRNVIHYGMKDAIYRNLACYFVTRDDIFLKHIIEKYYTTKECKQILTSHFILENFVVADYP